MHIGRFNHFNMDRGMAKVSEQGMRLAVAACVGLSLVYGSARVAYAGFEFVAPPAPESNPAVAPQETPIDGRGENVSLSVALRQILPEQIGFAPAEGVDLSVPVSWQGGKPWRDVLNEVLASSGLTATESGNVFLIQKPAAPAVVNTATTAEPAPSNTVDVKSDVVQTSPTGMIGGPIVAAPPPVAPEQSQKPEQSVALAAASVEVAPPPVEQPQLPVAESVASVPSVPVPESAPVAAVTQEQAPPVSAEAAAAQVTTQEAPIALEVPPIADEQTNPDAMAEAISEPAAEVWIGERGTTLRALLQDWSARANVDLHWSTTYDYPLQTSVNVEGSFEEAVRTLLAGFEKATPQPYGRLHKNKNVGSSVLIIEARGNDYGE